MFKGGTQQLHFLVEVSTEEIRHNSGQRLALYDYTIFIKIPPD